MDYPDISNSNLYSQVREVHEDSRQDFTLATAQRRPILSAASGALSPTRLNTSISTPLHGWSFLFSWWGDFPTNFGFCHTNFTACHTNF